MNAPLLTISPQADDAQTPLYGVVRLGSMLAALSIQYIREVVPRPAELVTFPCTMPEIMGAIELRGSIIPVLDLGKILGHDGQAQDASIIMLLRIAGQVFGIVIDEICGVIELRADHQTPMTIANMVSPLVRSGFAHAGRYGVVLDAPGLAALPGLAMAQERNLAAATAAEIGTPTLMFSAGAFHFGLEASFIEACVPHTHVAPSPLDDPLWIGMLAYNGKRIPVVDTLLLLGLGALEPARDYACVVIRMPGDHLVALRIDSVENILRIPARAQLPMQDFAIGHRRLLGGMHEAEHLSLLIAGQAVQAEAALADISQLEEADMVAARGGSAGQSIGQSAASGRARPFLLVTIGAGRFAIPLGQVDEILPFGAKGKVGLPAQANGIVGMIAHRGCAVPLYDLATHLGAGDRAVEQPYILLASAGERSLGFLLDGLTAVERTQMQTIAATHGENRSGIPGETIRASDGTTCSVLDLERIIVGITAQGDQTL